MNFPRVFEFIPSSKVASPRKIPGIQKDGRNFDRASPPTFLNQAGIVTHLKPKRLSRFLFSTIFLAAKSPSRRSASRTRGRERAHFRLIFSRGTRGARINRARGARRNPGPYSFWGAFKFGFSRCVPVSRSALVPG